MKFKAVLLSRAQKEIIQAWEWYEDKQPGLGNRFIINFEKQVDQLEKFPGSGPLRKKLYRESMLTDFPYLIIYRLNKK